jgi:hypothetical protein
MMFPYPGFYSVLRVRFLVLVWFLVLLVDVVSLRAGVEAEDVGGDEGGKEVGEVLCCGEVG